MFLYDVIFAINVRWIFTRFSTHQTREINSTLRCILDSNAIKKNTHTHIQSASFIHHRAMYFFPSTTILIRLSKTVIHETVPTVTDTDISLSHLLNHGIQILRDYDRNAFSFLLYFHIKRKKHLLRLPFHVIPRVIPIPILFKLRSELNKN